MRAFVHPMRQMCSPGPAQTDRLENTNVLEMGEKGKVLTHAQAHTYTGVWPGKFPAGGKASLATGFSQDSGSLPQESSGKTRGGGSSFHKQQQNFSPKSPPNFPLLLCLFLLFPTALPTRQLPASHTGLSPSQPQTLSSPRLPAGPARAGPGRPGCRGVGAPTRLAGVFVAEGLRVVLVPQVIGVVGQVQRPARAREQQQPEQQRQAGHAGHAGGRGGGGSRPDAGAGAGEGGLAARGGPCSLPRSPSPSPPLPLPCAAPSFLSPAPSPAGSPALAQRPLPAPLPSQLFLFPSLARSLLPPPPFLGK